MDTTSPATVRFGPFEVDLRSGVLRKAGTAVPLQEKPFRVLELLVRRPGEIVTREELRERLWAAGTFVDFEAGLNTAVKKVRVALDDSADNPLFIETVDRRGYRFIAPISSATRTRSPRRWVPLAVAAAVVVLTISAIQAFRLISEPAKRSAIRSLAVLPLSTEDASAESEYVAEVLTDQLIATTARGPSPLRVMSREATMRYRGLRPDPAAVAAELQVDAVVDGRMSRHGDRIRLALQLIESRTGDRLWAATYVSTLDGIQEMQQTASADILEHAGVTPRPRVGASPSSRGRAHLLYMRGRYEWNRVPPNYAEAMRFFQRAIDEDSGLAVAYVGLADCYATRRSWTQTPPGALNEDLRRAKDLARRALAIDATLGEAYATLGSIADDEYDFATADKAFLMAVRFAPSLPYVRGWYALHLTRLGRFDQAVAEARTGLELDPVSWFPRAFLAQALSMAGRDHEALRTINELATLYPDRPLRVSLFFIKHRLGDDDGAIEQLSALESLSNHGGPTIVQTYHRAGFNPAVATAIERLSEHNPHYFTLARLNAAIGNREGAVKALQRSYELRETSFGYVNVSPELASIREDARVSSMIQAIKLR